MLMLVLFCLVVVLFALMVVVVMLLELLTAVLLVAYNQLQVAVTKVERVVPHQFVVLDLLIGQPLAVAAARPALFMGKLSCLQVTLALDDAGLLVDGAPYEVGVAPLLVDAQQEPSCTLGELRPRHVAVVFVLIGVGPFVGVAGIPHETALVAGDVEREVEETVVGLVFRRCLCPDFSLRQCRCTVEDEHAGHGVGAVHQRGGAFEYLYGMHAFAVYLYAVLSAPLLTFLAHALVHHDDAVVAQSADDGLGDAAACGNLCYTRLTGHGIDDVGRRCLVKFTAADNGNRGRGVLDLGVAGHACHHQFVELEVTVEHVAAVSRMHVVIVVLMAVVVMLMFMLVLCCHRHAHAQQRQDE